MLVLTRKVNVKDEDTIVIDGKIRIKILGVQGRQVRIGIDADKSVSVHRAEVQKRIEEFTYGDCKAK